MTLAERGWYSVSNASGWADARFWTGERWCSVQPGAPAPDCTEGPHESFVEAYFAARARARAKD